MKTTKLPLLSTLSATLLLISAVPANAMMLEGSVKQEAAPAYNAAPAYTAPYVPQAAPQQQMAPRAPMGGQAAAYYGPAAAPQAHMVPQTGSMTLTSAVSANAKIAARVQTMQGTWQCVTQVIGSTTPGVTPGQIVRCDVQYIRDAQGNLLESWSENGWTPSTAAAVKLDSEVITVSHLSSYPSRGGTISAHSTDALKIVAPDTIIAQGIVTQYSNGKPMGQYKTSSVLHKVG